MCPSPKTNNEKIKIIVYLDNTKNNFKNFRRWRLFVRRRTC